jgi:hypothetical protein
MAADIPDIVFPDIFNEEISHAEAVTGFQRYVTMSDSDSLRFLRARGGSLLKAVDMANAYQAWRCSLMVPIPPHNLMFSPNIIWAMPDHIEDDPHIRLLPAAHHGFDKEGHPIYWERTGYIQSTFTEVAERYTVDQLVHFHLCLQEVNVIRFAYASEKFRKNISKGVTVLDVKNLTVSLDFRTISYMKQIIHMDQNFYPERLHRVFIINAPFFFSLIFNIFKPFIDKRTVDKIVILGSNYLPTLEHYVDASVIPVEMGGQCTNCPWNARFSEDSGASRQQIDAYYQSKYTSETIPTLLTKQEIEALEAARAVADAARGKVTTGTTAAHTESDLY